MTDYTPEGLARLFHETYERLAPRYDYRTREASAKPWEDVPEQNRVLMVATCAEVIARWAGRLLPEDTRTVAALVNEFHRRPGVDCVQPTHPTVDVPGALDRVAYVEEEARELREAVETGDVVGSADALADLAYVVYGAAWRFGIPLDAVVAEVHRSNMTKTATPGDGKAVKGPGYSPPDVARVLGVPATDMSTAPNTSVGAHSEAHSAHIPDVPEEKP